MTTATVAMVSSRSNRQVGEKADTEPTLRDSILGPGWSIADPDATLTVGETVVQPPEVQVEQPSPAQQEAPAAPSPERERKTSFEEGSAALDRTVTAKRFSRKLRESHQAKQLSKEEFLRIASKHEPSKWLIDPRKPSSKIGYWDLTTTVRARRLLCPLPLYHGGTAAPPAASGAHTRSPSRHPARPPQPPPCTAPCQGTALTVPDRVPGRVPGRVPDRVPGRVLSLRSSSRPSSRRTRWRCWAPPTRTATPSSLSTA